MKRKLRRLIGRLICKITEKHSPAIMEAVAGGALIQLTCPRCGEFAIITRAEMGEQIIEALTKEGRYTNIERIA